MLEKSRGKTMLAFYNHLSRKIEKFRPLKRGRVALYTCGPTVYNYAHIGNLRTYVFEDVLRRALEHVGYKVNHVMNLTDIDDKTIRDAAAAGKSLKEFTEHYAAEFFEDVQQLNILAASRYPKATAHISEMVKLIGILLKKKLAYVMDDGVYFNISAFPRYGRLSRLKPANLKTGARVSYDEYSKNDARDFALWKFKRSGEPSWPAPFGEGRPGWHIECSAMSMKYLGPTLDIHAGAIDLLFPHHEDEIAQSEGATGKLFSRFFLEAEHLLVEGCKMSKSLANTFTLRDIIEHGIDPLAFRYLALTAHYRAKLNFTWESLKAAEESLNRLRAFVLELKERKTEKRKTKSLAAYKADFETALSKDLDTPKAIAVLWKLVHETNKRFDSFDPKAVLELILASDEVLGLRLKSIKKETVPLAVAKLAKDRETLRKAGNWAAADKIRDQLAKLGWRLKDTPSGPRLSKSLK